MTAISRTILVFWAAWLGVVTATNILNAMQVLGVVPESFRFASGNWQWINQVMDPLSIPRWLQGTLFAGVIGWEALGSALYCRAAVCYRGLPLSQESAVSAACFVNLALWCAFQVLDEVFLAYQPESVHRVIFANQLLTIIVLFLLPGELKTAEPCHASRPT